MTKGTDVQVPPDVACWQGAGRRLRRLTEFPLRINSHIHCARLLRNLVGKPSVHPFSVLYITAPGKDYSVAWGKPIGDKEYMNAQ